MAGIAHSELINNSRLYFGLMPKEQVQRALAGKADPVADVAVARGYVLAMKKAPPVSTPAAPSGGGLGADGHLYPQ